LETHLRTVRLRTCGSASSFPCRPRMAAAGRPRGRTSGRSPSMPRPPVLTLCGSATTSSGACPVRLPKGFTKRGRSPPRSRRRRHASKSASWSRAPRIGTRGSSPRWRSRPTRSAAGASCWVSAPDGTTPRTTRSATRPTTASAAWRRRWRSWSRCSVGRQSRSEAASTGSPTPSSCLRPTAGSRCSSRATARAYFGSRLVRGGLEHGLVRRAGRASSRAGRRPRECPR
jgi:hypothetical protein